MKFSCCLNMILDLLIHILAMFCSYDVTWHAADPTMSIFAFTYMHQNHSVFHRMMSQNIKHYEWQFFIVFRHFRWVCQWTYYKMHEQQSYMFVSLLLHLLGPSEENRTLRVNVLCSNNFLGTRQILMQEHTCMIPV